MVTEELKTFIAKMRAVGKTDPEITAELKTAGWGETDITSALNPQSISTADSQSPEGSDSQEEKIKTKSHRSTWIWFALIIAVFFVGGYLALRILPNLLVRSLKKQGQTSVTYPTPTTITTSPSSNQAAPGKPIMFPNNIIQFTIPNSWYTKEETGGQNSYQMKFVYKTDPDESEDYPEYALQATVTYPAGQSAKINNLNGMVAYVRSLLTKTADSDKVKAADSTSDFSQNLQSTTNTTFLPGKTDILADKDLAVAGLPGHSFEYTNEINKIISRKDKDASGKFVDSAVNVHRVEHVRDLVVFDRQNNLIVIEFKAIDSQWSQRIRDFDQVAGSLVISSK